MDKIILLAFIISAVLLGYLLSIFFGQWANSDYKQAQKLLFNYKTKAWLIRVP
jgi:hypothetical protein